MKILVVEDQPLIAFVLADLLEEAGHTVMGPAASVEEALAVCKGNPPDLALIDIELQGTATGVDLARLLNQWWGKISVFVSGSYEEARQARELALGLIAKPYSTQMLLHGVGFFAAVKSQKPVPPKAYGIEIF